ncbi:hypothetical protein HanIR_Chr09g0439341 [Helianthus annuus]|nr:hypothetical protein HanIR_Chr09g0439341 [Helianthus annuus]
MFHGIHMRHIPFLSDHMFWIPLCYRMISYVTLFSASKAQTRERSVSFFINNVLSLCLCLRDFIISCLCVGFEKSSPC